MNIRAKLTLLFFSLVTIILSITFFSIYFFSENYRKDDFYRRLRNRATNTAKVLTQFKEVNAELLKRMEKSNPANLPGQYVSVFKKNHVEIYASDGPDPIEFDTALLNDIINKKELRFQQGQREVLGFLMEETSDKIIIIASATDFYGKDAINNLRTILLLTFAGSLVMISALGWIYSGRVLQPISNIVKEVSSISEVNLNLRLHEGNQNDELNRLAQTFNKMLGRLENAFTSQKNFISNASHEIKTPITVMSGQIEVTLLQERDVSYYISTLVSVLKTLKSLNELSSRLLMLAHSSAELTTRNFSAVRIDDIVWDIKTELSSTHPSYGIDVILDSGLSDQVLSINGDEQLLKVAVLNLIDNGCKYSTNHHVTVKLCSEADQVILQCSNRGKEMTHEDISRIFQPFFRREVDKNEKGFGIGLSLIASIVKLHRGKIDISSGDAMIIVTIKLPVRRPVV